MSDWFCMLGEPLSDSEREHAHEYLHGLGIDDALPVVGVCDWDAARRTISFPAWDRRWWEAERAEKRRLYQKMGNMAEPELLAALSTAVGRITEPVLGAAMAQAARRGCADAGLIRAAAGAAGEALYLAELARLAGATERHAFRRKQALFAGGHWPLGIVTGRYHVF